MILSHRGCFSLSVSLSETSKDIKENGSAGSLQSLWLLIKHAFIDFRERRGRGKHRWAAYHAPPRGRVMGDGAAARRVGRTGHLSGHRTMLSHQPHRRGPDSF